MLRPFISAEYIRQLCLARALRIVLSEQPITAHEHDGHQNRKYKAKEYEYLKKKK
jgi:hypothetical protein